MRKFDDMKMPGYYSEMDDSEKGLTGGSDDSDIKKGAGYETMGIGGLIASVGGGLWYHGAKGVEPVTNEQANRLKCGKYSSTLAQQECRQDIAKGKVLVAVGAVALVAGAAISIVNACTDDD